MLRQCACQHYEISQDNGLYTIFLIMDFCIKASSYNRYSIPKKVERWSSTYIRVLFSCRKYGMQKMSAEDTETSDILQCLHRMMSKPSLSHSDHHISDPHCTKQNLVAMSSHPCRLFYDVIDSLKYLLSMLLLCIAQPLGHEALFW